MNAYNFWPVIFERDFDKTFTFASVLSYHKSIAEYMPPDGLIELCERQVLWILYMRRDILDAAIQELHAGMEDQDFTVYTCLEQRAHIMLARLQLVNLCIRYALEENFSYN